MSIANESYKYSKVQLKSFLQQIFWATLIVIGVLRHVPSPKLWQNYLPILVLRSSPFALHSCQTFFNLRLLCRSSADMFFRIIPQLFSRKYLYSEYLLDLFLFHLYQCTPVLNNGSEFSMSLESAYFVYQSHWAHSHRVTIKGHHYEILLS